MKPKAMALHATTPSGWKTERQARRNRLFCIVLVFERCNKGELTYSRDKLQENSTVNWDVASNTKTNKGSDD